MLSAGVSDLPSPQVLGNLKPTTDPHVSLSSCFLREGWFLYIALVVLELTLLATVGLKPKRSGVKGVDHHFPERMTFLSVNFV